MTDETSRSSCRAGAIRLLRDRLRSGVGAALGGVAAPVFAGTARAVSPGSASGAGAIDGFPQAHWSRCGRCGGLYYLPRRGVSACPAGGRHGNNPDGGDYVLIRNPGVVVGDAQAGWRHCGKCAGLYYFPRRGVSACPAGGSHGNGPGDGGDYALFWS